MWISLRFKGSSICYKAMRSTFTSPVAILVAGRTDNSSAMTTAQYTYEEIYDPKYGEEKPRLLQCEGYILPYYTKPTLDAVRDMDIRSDDVFLATFPKSGTTWAQEVVYLIESEVDIETANEEQLDQRFPYLEYFHSSVVTVSNLPSPRFIKTHMPYPFLPMGVRQGKAKVIYVARNPKDVVVSYYHFLKGLNKVGYQGSFEEFFEDFMNGKVPYGPWWKHVLDYWERRNDSNIYYLTYEAMHQDFPGTIRSLASFLGRQLDEKQIETIRDHCQFEAMKSNPNTNYTWLEEQGMKKKDTQFMRKGQVGDWTNHLTPKMSGQMDEMITNRLSHSGLGFLDKLS